MTTQTQTQIESFLEYVQRKIADGHTDITPEQALAMWREFNASVKAIQEALDDMEAGDEGVPADEVIAELHQRIENA